MLAQIIGGVLGGAFAKDRQAAKDLEIQQRIAPVGQLSAGEMAETAMAVAAPAAEVSGESVFQTSCSACHSTGVADAPKIGEAGEWSGRIAQGMDLLVEHAINGFNTMPTKGGSSALSDGEVRAAVEHIVNNSQ